MIEFRGEARSNLKLLIEKIERIDANVDGLIVSGAKHNGMDIARHQEGWYKHWLIVTVLGAVILVMIEHVLPRLFSVFVVK